MIASRRPFAFGLFGLLIGLAGCSSEPPKGTVEGTVTYEGKPAAGGIITFMSKSGGIPVSTNIGMDGNYRATDVPVGENMVSVVPTPESTPAAGQKIKETGAAPAPKGVAIPVLKMSQYPARYADFATSKLDVKVKPLSEGATSFPVVLTK